MTLLRFIFTLLVEEASAGFTASQTGFCDYSPRSKAVAYHLSIQVVEMATMMGPSWEIYCLMCACYITKLIDDWYCCIDAHPESEGMQQLVLEAYVLCRAALLGVHFWDFTLLSISTGNKFD